MMSMKIFENEFKKLHFHNVASRFLMLFEPEPFFLSFIPNNVSYTEQFKYKLRI